MIGRRVHADGAGTGTPGGRDTFSEPNPDSHPPRAQFYWQCRALQVFSVGNKKRTYSTHFLKVFTFQQSALQFGTPLHAWAQ
jgi:hypothetical protein